MEKPIALVLGCTGQDGSLVSKSLLKQGYKVIGTTRNTKIKNESHRRIGIDNKIKLITNDLLRSEGIKELIKKEKPCEIYNFAAQSSVGLSFEFPKETKNSIELITSNLLNACRDLEYAGGIFFAGSSEMFGETATPANCNTKLNPRSPYGYAKTKSYLMVKKYRENYGLKCATGIFFNHESKLRSNNFVTQKIIHFAKNIFNGLNSKINLGNTEVIRDWGYAVEYVEAAQKIIRANNIKDYTICTGQSVSLAKFIDIVFGKLNLNWKDYVEIDKTLFRPNEIKMSYGDPKQIFFDLGWKTKYDLEKLIVHLLAN